MALGGFTHFKMKKLLLLLFLLPNLVMAGPDCNWKSINSETIKLKKFFVEITTYDCNHEHYKDENITKKTASILDTKKNILFKDISKAREADLFKIINIPEGFPYLAIFESTMFASNYGSYLHIYHEGKKLQEVAVLQDPINLYQANNGVGSEQDVVGFYVSGGRLLIDSLTTDGQETGVCNACQEYSVETLELQSNKLVRINLRDFNIGTYKPLE